jgi:hypothetical protein
MARMPPSGRTARYRGSEPGSHATEFKGSGEAADNQEEKVGSSEKIYRGRDKDGNTAGRKVVEDGVIYDMSLWKAIFKTTWPQYRVCLAYLLTGSGCHASSNTSEIQS